MPDEAIRIEALPASYGDCLLVSCALSGGKVWRLLVDTGPKKTYATLRQRLLALPSDAEGRRRIDLLVVSHIDHDHIGGVSRLLADDELKIDYGDIWFNAPRVRGVAEGERFAEALSLPEADRPWNLAFDRGIVAMPAEDQPVRHQTEAGPVITLLSPTPERLDALFKVWNAELAKLRRGESDPVEPDASRGGLETREAATLEDLAARRTKLDNAKANGSSIAFLLEHRGASVLLAADAFATVLGPALRALRASRSLTGPLPVDVFKLSHHGSSANVTTDLLAEVDSRHCIVSTDNKHFDHPDDEAMARVVLGQPRATIWFNHDTPRNRRWSESGLLDGHRREVRFPAAPQAGVTLSLEAVGQGTRPVMPAICPKPIRVQAVTPGPTPAPASATGAPVPMSAASATGAPTASAAERQSPAEDLSERPRRLDVQVVNGDIRFVREPLLVGHYRDSLLSGTEDVVDRLCGGALRRSLAARLYPEVVGAHQIFVNRTAPSDDPIGLPRPKAVIVAALGDEGQLKQESLSYAVRQAILGYAQREFEHEPRPGEAPPKEFRLSSVLLGSGGTGVHAAIAAQMIVEGALEANRMLEVAGWPRLAALTLIESYLDRAAEAWHALRARQRSMQSAFELGEHVAIGKGGKRYRIESGYRGTEYDLIRALQTYDARRRPVISYTVDSHLARTETRAQVAQGPLIRRLVERGSNVAQSDTRIGRTLYNLLVPVELGAVLGGNATTVLELDRNTAAIPWEMLDTDEGVEPGRRSDAEPWAIRARLLRKMQTDRYRANFVPATAHDAVLVIGEPRYPPAYPPLEGTRREALSVVQAFQAHRSKHPVYPLLDKPDAEAVINELHARPYRVIHIAGHGAPGEDQGVVLSDDLFLGPAEVASLRRVPELIFLNCCHLAHQSAEGLLAQADFDRTRFASNIASALIDAGVRCVVAAGWAVADDAAEKFAGRFYEALLRDGSSFLDAVTEARKAARECGGNTWAAYQCYGDPQWRWEMRQDPDADKRAAPSGDGEDIASPAGLAIVLSNIAIDCDFDEAGRPAALQRLAGLATRYGGLWGANGEIAEGFGLAFGRAGDEKRARDWYRKAVEGTDGGVRMTAFEQYANFVGRVAESEPSEAALAQLDESIESLKRLDGLAQSGERAALIGSAYRRKVLVRERLDAPTDAKQAQAWQQAIADDVRQSRAFYAEALERKRKSGSKDAFYPLMLLLAGRVRERLLGDGATMTPVANSEWEQTRRLCEQADPQDFWSISAQHELQMWKAIDRRALASEQGALRQAFEALRERVPSTYYWKSVRTSAAFVVTPYARLETIDDAEREAARGLLAIFDRFAEPGL